MGKAIVVNLVSGPGAGKSSFCASIFAELKWNDINCEMALEYAKDHVWEENTWALQNQFYIFGNQLQRIHRLSNKVDVIVTDSPLLLSIIYDAKNNEAFRKVIIDEHNRFLNMNFFIERVKKYNPKGRLQTLEQALELDKQIKDMLKGIPVEYESIKGYPENSKVIARKVLERLGEN